MLIIRELIYGLYKTKDMRHILAFLFFTISVSIYAQPDYVWHGWDFTPSEEPVQRQYTEYTVKKGYHRYIPGIGTTFYRNHSLCKVEWSVVFDVSSEYNWYGDNDQLDWNKGGGIYYDWKRRDRDNIMWAWRWNQDSSRYELTVYRDWKYEDKIGFNDTKTRSDDVLMIAQSGDIVDISFIRKGGKEWYVVFRNNTRELDNAGTVKVRVNPRWSQRLPAWFGGSNNSAGRYGGVASQDMTMWIWYNAENQ